MRQDFNKIYSMTNSNSRYIIIEKINNKELFSNDISGKRLNWWLNKHYPDNEIPKNIYLLGNGTIKELYERYIKKYNYIEWTEFINYTRELIKQTIMI